MNPRDESNMQVEQALCQSRLDLLVETSAEVNGALVSTVDGFEVAARVDRSLSPEKLSAMTSSLLALAEAISQESGIGNCRDLVIDASGGRVLLMDIPSRSRKLLLTVLCDRGATLGSVLWAARNTRESILRDLDSSPAA